MPVKERRMLPALTHMQNLEEILKKNKMATRAEIGTGEMLIKGLYELLLISQKDSGDLTHNM